MKIDEQELLVSFSGRDDRIKIYTSYPSWIKRFDSYVKENKNWKCEHIDTMNGEVVSKQYSAPKKYLKFIRKERQMSDEQRTAAAERLRQARANKKNSSED